MGIPLPGHSSQLWLDEPGPVAVALTQDRCTEKGQKATLFQAEMLAHVRMYRHSPLLTDVKRSVGTSGDLSHGG